MSRILAVDCGERRVGLAVSDPEGRIATPLEVVQVQSAQQVADRIAEVCRDKAVTLVLVGLPVGLAGQEGALTQGARQMARVIEETTALPVEFLDERLTTRIAERAMLESDASRAKRRAGIDAVAAALLLQSYLDALRYREAKPQSGQNH